MPTFKHRTAGSTVITPNGLTYRFIGKTGGVGFITTDDSEAVSMLRSLAKNPSIPIEEVEEASEIAVNSGVSKAAAPEIAQSVADAAANTAAATSPKAAALQERLASVIAQG